ncbi:hypothetical protein KUTeg_014021 [Tegillarca granosa]|uniref:C2 domain-containing protein n=1 Tax=Tegillarca granosa TaxID=220873 RepID=A0ABQ9EZU2_TEGGR|nr:hypothetical protein KUTeg_014021 [Tegillarca granosa]
MTLEGNAYAYHDEDTSSDSDDEVLKHYQQTLTQQNTLRRTETFQSDKSAKSKKSHKDGGMSSRASLIDERATPVTSDDDATPRRRSLAAPKSPSVQNQELVQIDEPSGTASTASVSPHNEAEEEENKTGEFDNQAYQEEQMTMSMSGSEQLSLHGALSTDEHLFDVSDLQKEPPLISKCGSLEITFSYNAERSRMAVTIHQAQEIPSKERGGASSSQVRLLLLPTRKQRHKTKVKTGENPNFEDTFMFTKIPPEEVHGMGLRIRLYGMERMRRERMIGESIIGFASLNLDMASTHWVILEPRSNLSHGGMPELLLGLAYNGTTGRLSVEVIKGSNFRNMAMNRAPGINSSGEEEHSHWTDMRESKGDQVCRWHVLLES